MKVSDFSSCVVVRRCPTTFGVVKVVPLGFGVFDDDAPTDLGGCHGDLTHPPAVIVKDVDLLAGRKGGSGDETRRDDSEWQGVKEEAAMKRDAAALSRGDRGAVILSGEIGWRVRSCDADGNTRRRRFFVLREYQSSSSSGAGLGLAICKSCVVVRRCPTTFGVVKVVPLGFGVFDDDAPTDLGGCHGDLTHPPAVIVKDVDLLAGRKGGSGDETRRDDSEWQGVKEEAAMKRDAAALSRGDRGAVILSGEIGWRVRSCDADGNTRWRRRWQGVKEEAAMKRDAAALSRGDRGAVILSGEIGWRVRSCDADGNTRRRRFFVLREYQSSSSSGAGLGLAICKSEGLEKEAQLHLLSKLGSVAIQIRQIIKLQTEAKHIVEVVASPDLNPSSKMKMTVVFLLGAIKEVSNIQDNKIAYLPFAVWKNGCAIWN
ncbi:hypothetical protein LR48_Vigan01g079000 [Vigna angularis]|uniref:Uncharacterized protein n=1 Tax=Phaseolus angularis TaxID=3914 RepID=A0A0L9TL10_PHAAN|nr:hypothetical protein LR48_Vigan01g079000 [Vigna angularis]